MLADQIRTAAAPGVGSPLARSLPSGLKVTERTILLSTHVLSEAAALGRRVIVIHRGRLVAQGTLQDVVGAVPGAQTLTDAFVALVGEGRGGTRQLSFLP